MIVTSYHEIKMLLNEAQSNRIIASHNINLVSSRSHMLVMLTIEQKMKNGLIKRSKLNFADLAGSEKMEKALGKNADKKLKEENKYINLSLTHFTTSINELSKHKNPVYRNSKLTYILKESLGGNSKTSLIVNCSPHILNRMETILTLRLALTAKQVINISHENKIQTRLQLIAYIKHLEKENHQLKLENGQLKNNFNYNMDEKKEEDEDELMSNINNEFNEENEIKLNEERIKKLEIELQQMQEIIEKRNNNKK